MTAPSAAASHTQAYEASLRLCFRGAPGEAELLAAHAAHVAAAAANAPLARLVAALRALKPPDDEAQAVL